MSLHLSRFFKNDPLKLKEHFGLDEWRLDTISSASLYAEQATPSRNRQCFVNKLLQLR